MSRRPALLPLLWVLLLLLHHWHTVMLNRFLAVHIDRPHKHRHRQDPSIFAGLLVLCRMWTKSYGQPLQAVYARGASHDTAVALTAAPVATISLNKPVQGRLSVGSRPG